jgi:hypothetical protein
VSGLDEQALTDILAALETAVASLGRYERVNFHEPKNAPGPGLTAAIWLQSLYPYPQASGLAATSGVMVSTIRSYTPILQEPIDAIDPTLAGAAHAVFRLFSAGFTLGGLVRNVDLLGAGAGGLSAGLSWRAGYAEQDRRMFRIIDVSVPLVVNDIFDQAP